MNAKPMTYILAEFQHNFIYILLISQISSTSDTMTDGFDWALIVFLHDAGGIYPTCISPQLQTIDTKPLLEKVRTHRSQITDSMNTMGMKFPGSSRPDV